MDMNKNYAINRLVGWLNGELDTLRNDLFQYMNEQNKQGTPEELRQALLDSNADICESINMIYKEIKSQEEKE